MHRLVIWEKPGGLLLDPEAPTYAVAEVELVKGPAIVRHVFLDPSASNALVTLQVAFRHWHCHRCCNDGHYVECHALLQQ